MNSEVRKDTFWTTYGQYLLIGALVFVVPALLSGYERMNDRADFREKLSQVKEDCLSRSKGSDYPPILCLEIERAASMSSERATSISTTQTVLQGLLFGLFCGAVAQRRRITKLEERLNA